MSPLTQIRQSGFIVNIIGNSFKVEPASKLTETLRELLRSNKALIISELRAEQTVNKVISQIIVDCYTPNGHLIQVEARDAVHADFLQRMNPINAAAQSKIKQSNSR